MQTPRAVRHLNDLLRRELGESPYGEGIFQWAWSENLLWPTCRTGKMVTRKITVPIIGGGEAEAEITEPEYKARRMTFKYKRQWLITKWIKPESLPQWQAMFPGADYPARGYRINTDWANKPDLLPTYQDTMVLIAQLKDQMSGMSYAARLADMEADRQKAQDRIQKTTEDRIENCFTAFLNPDPGKRGQFVSFGGHDLEKKEQVQNG